MPEIFFAVWGLLIFTYAAVLHIWLIVLAFRTNIVWGLVSFIPLGSVIFAFTHWKVAAKPFLLYVIGLPVITGVTILTMMFTPLGKALEKHNSQAVESTSVETDNSGNPTTTESTEADKTSAPHTQLHAHHGGHHGKTHR